MTNSHASTVPEPASGSDSVPIASRYVRALLNRHDVAPMRHVTTVAQVLDIGYTLVYRRMTGAVAWEVEEIEKVAAHFGETLAEVFAGEQADDHLPAVLVVDGLRLTCQVVAGGIARDPERNSLVAVRVGAQWVVVPASEAGVGAAYEVKRLVVEGSGDRRWRVAILDDDASDAASIKEHFTGCGFEAEAFSAVEDLIGRMKVNPFDAYIVDWVLGQGSAAELLGMIRADDRQCPIAVLTGKMKEDLMLEPAVAEAVTTYKLLFFEKPTRLPIISAQVLQALTGR